MSIFDGVLHYARTAGGMVMSLHGDMAGSFRPRLDDYRVLFALHDNTMRIANGSAGSEE